MADGHLKRCTKCGEYKAASDFQSDRQKRDGLRSSCKQCCSIAWSQRLAREVTPPPPKSGDGDLTHTRLLSLVSYDPATGVFTSIASRGRAYLGTTTGNLETTGYIRVTIDGKRYKAHRLAWFYVNGEWPNGQIDHINRDRADNRIANLRESNDYLNNQNRKPHKSSGPAPGVRIAYGNYVARIGVMGKRLSLGTFKTLSEAIAARKAAEMQYWGKT